MFELPKLDYPYDALEPHIDAHTMEIHHLKHHQGYTDKFNAVLEKYPIIGSMPLENIFQKLNDLEIAEPDRQAIRNNGGGYINHKIFWQSMAPEKQIDHELIKEIETSFGSVENFKQQFSDIAKNQFGSGWAWLVRDQNNALKIYSLLNQDSPYTLGHTPIFNLDVWEHAYYLKYQNKRPDYVEAWWNVLKFL
ncbi:superoxide dismutase [Candidatus Falkowbacteria bacterium RIFOXYD2_FULL_35_9]|uniref:Superoxide dismutase n=1 Tax=Candidatus Falkowbacteria bacterium RIFOXYC2_FULL_36_12 TaxID=1798002 RepID=A0A1F5SWI8_9BACT|nr:MAG: superoxide dismutase [Candidatus Falkowbacteria bacterium RIFOXYB2_FULL_35_7]OGF31012.1 MAG: superoxide dismutase [Candidatus Falkowbacteria bacterium RIFOXYC2_FULL_36_12]OGF34440.1 MAG: superoxide dismutase [Candidatus Falkowbacteria bacterium RIFOXYA2_FULL_35_8]OGF47854.1 MAG: superoxide dismutase [Candidatus Falkowbacteria bacterium RIFOXYD2_FULL_35_9]